MRFWCVSSRAHFLMADTAAAHHQQAAAVLLPIALGLRGLPAAVCGASCPVPAAVLFGSGGGGFRSLRP